MGGDMKYNREAAEEASQIARDATQHLNGLLDVVRKGGRNSGVDAAKCANAIQQLRSDLAGIEDEFRKLERTRGDDAAIEIE